MDETAPGTPLAEDHHGRQLVIASLSLLGAVIGLSLAAVGVTGDSTVWLIAGIALGALGPLLIRWVVPPS
jgi:hypothetical protein